MAMSGTERLEPTPGEDGKPKSEAALAEGIGQIELSNAKRATFAEADFQRADIVQKLKGARDRKLEVSTLKTLKGKPKLLGTKSSFETQPQVKEVLRLWIQKSKLEKGDMRSMQKALEIAEVKTKYGKALAWSTMCQHV